jgi:tetratricopeptide (TPR) repeat protein
MIRPALAAVGLIAAMAIAPASAQSPFRGPAELERRAAECTNAQREYDFADVERSCTTIIRSDIASSGARAFAYRQRGLVHLQRGDQTRALADFSDAVRYNPHFAEGYISRAALYEARGEYDLGAADYDEVLRILPSFGPAYNARCWLRTLSGRNLAAARIDCDRAIELGVGAPAYDTRGLLNLKEGKFDAAFADYGTAVDAGHEAHSLYGRGLAALRLGQTETGQADIAIATASDPQLAAAYQGYGVAP